MQRLLVFTLLAFSLLMGAPVLAQRSGGESHGNGPAMQGGNGSRPASRPTLSGGYFGRRPSAGRFYNYGDAGYGFASWYYPYWEEQPFEQYSEPRGNAASPPVVVVEERESRSSAPAPVAAIESPKLIEVPQTKEVETKSKPVPPAVFVLASGERIEAATYMLTANSLRVEVGRQQRIIPLDQLNLDATTAANRDRGIELQIPRDNAHIFLGF